MEQQRHIDWRAIGALVIFCLSLVNMGLYITRAGAGGDPVDMIVTAGWAFVAVAQLWIFGSRIVRRGGGTSSERRTEARMVVEQRRRRDWRSDPLMLGLAGAVLLWIALELAAWVDREDK